METFQSVSCQEVKTSGSELDERVPYMSKVSNDLANIFRFTDYKDEPAGTLLNHPVNSSSLKEKLRPIDVRPAPHSAS